MPDPDEEVVTDEESLLWSFLKNRAASVTPAAYLFGLGGKKSDEEILTHYTGKGSWLAFVRSAVNMSLLKTMAHPVTMIGTPLSQAWQHFGGSSPLPSFDGSQDQDTEMTGYGAESLGEFAELSPEQAFDKAVDLKGAVPFEMAIGLMSAPQIWENFRAGVLESHGPEGFFEAIDNLGSTISNYQPENPEEEKALEEYPTFLQKEQEWTHGYVVKTKADEVKAFLRGPEVKALIAQCGDLKTPETRKNLTAIAQNVLSGVAVEFKKSANEYSPVTLELDDKGAGEMTVYWGSEIFQGDKKTAIPNAIEAMLQAILKKKPELAAHFPAGSIAPIISGHIVESPNTPAADNTQGTAAGDENKNKQEEETAFTDLFGKKANAFLKMAGFTPATANVFIQQAIGWLIGQITPFLPEGLASAFNGSAGGAGTTQDKTNQYGNNMVDVTKTTGGGNTQYAGADTKSSYKSAASHNG